MQCGNVNIAKGLTLIECPDKINCGNAFLVDNPEIRFLIESNSDFCEKCGLKLKINYNNYHIFKCDTCGKMTSNNRIIFFCDCGGFFTEVKE